ncbi:Thioredoxin reductase [Candidatus Magnetaquicoccaceae bacterium FCR-1]|uniref:Thioredoxin reductase n=1 Tax=Candidatus Magnetaquiglobus chichijimensis TaxID=3141448 RepID=A0ABQ0C7P1_9PROT
MAKETHHRLIILGSGPAGYTAAIYAGRANLKPILIQGMQPGGQLTTTTEVDNFPGFEHGIQGPELMEKMRAQAERFDATMVYDTIVATDLKTRPMRLTADSGDLYTCDALIIATGASARWLGLESEQKLKGFGVSACATCDGFFFRGQEIAVVGGGNTAAEEAIFLTHFASKVYLVHRRDQLRAEKVMQDKVRDNPKIVPVWDSVIEEILGEPGQGGVSGIRVKNVKTGQSSELPLTGVFIAIGHSPNTAIFGDQLETIDGGYLVTRPDSTATAIPGVFAAGDVQDRHYRQAVTAAGTGCMAALEAERFLAE